MRIKVLPGQTIFDIAVRYYGSIEGVKDLKAKNPTVITSYEVELEPGQELEVGDPIDQDVVDVFVERKQNPSTGVLYVEDEEQGVYGEEYANEYD